MQRQQIRSDIVGKRISIEKSVVINATAEQVFAFISNGSNDPRWRTEVDRMDVQGPTEPGTQMVEYSTFFRWFHTVTPTVIETLQSPTRFVLQTPDTHPDWLRSTRTVEPVDSQTSRFVYRLEFDLSTMKQISPSFRRRRRSARCTCAASSGTWATPGGSSRRQTRLPGTLPDMAGLR